MARYLTGDEILIMHAEVINQTGGLHGVRDLGLFASLLERPKTSFGDKEAYPDIYTKAAVYFQSLAQYHVFVDGNKRTALTATARFLFVNGLRLACSSRQAESFTLRIVTHSLDIPTIATWLRAHTRSLK